MNQIQNACPLFRVLRVCLLTADGLWCRYLCALYESNQHHAHL